ncbi:MAG: hypothetical protein K2X26_00605 [Chitinophagaceae bacterium]|nr:hypothetical protein [Chitinophagaceae bacterium]
MVLTDEQKTDAYPVASLEVGTIATEKLYYNIPDGATVNKNTVAGYPNDTYTNPNDYIQKLNGNNQKVGTSIVLRVMAGDKVNIRANSWYRLNGVTPGTAVNPINDIVAALMGGLTGNAGKGWLGPMVPSGYVPPGMADFLTRQSNAANSTNKPKAYLNYILFDEQLKPVVDTVNFNSNQTSGFDQVGASEEFKNHIITDKEVTRNGYLYIYVSNATQNVDVFFDNLQVTHNRGPLTEETHYYPFGLTINGISSKAAGSLENKKKYNGNEIQAGEFSDGASLNTMDFNARFYEQQLGRFWQIDPVIKENESPYAWNTNNPSLFADPDGKDSVQRAKALEKAQEYLDKKKEGNQYLMGAKGEPGQEVDCSGLVSKCVQAGDEKDPNLGTKPSGVLNIQSNTKKVADKEVQSGNIVTFKFKKGYPYHTGLIKSVTKDKNGNIISFVMINSVSGTGPKEQNVVIGEGKLGNGVAGYYKWDSKEDKSAAPGKSNNQSSHGSKSQDFVPPASMRDAYPMYKISF